MIVVGPDDTVLLLCGHEPERTDKGHWWFLPGGGLEGDETPLAAARRELIEETGLVAATLVALDERTSRYRFGGQIVSQHDVLFGTRSDSLEITTAGWTDLERASITEVRWWTHAALEATDERIYPPDLLDLVALFDALL